jgi:hypothetical protein
LLGRRILFQASSPLKQVDRNLNWKAKLHRFDF